MFARGGRSNHAAPNARPTTPETYPLSTQQEHNPDYMKH
jgi:hypothetical protein